MVIYNRGNSRQSMERGAPKRAGKRKKDVSLSYGALLFSPIRMLTAIGLVASLFKTKKPLLEVELKEVVESFTVFCSSSPHVRVLKLAPVTLLFVAPVAVESSGQSLIHS